MQALESEYKIQDHPQLDPRQMLIKAAHPEFSAESIIRWEGADLLKIKLPNVVKSLSYLAFSSNSPFQVLYFVESLQSIVQVNHKEGA
jgi:hypothetical protein